MQQQLRRQATSPVAFEQPAVDHQEEAAWAPFALPATSSDTPTLDAVAGLSQQAAEGPDLGGTEPSRLVSTVKDPGATAAVYDLDGRHLGRFPADRPGYIFFMYPGVYDRLATALSVRRSGGGWGVDQMPLTEVLHDDIRVTVDELIGWCACYLDKESLADCAAVAKRSGSGMDFRERFFVVGFRPPEKRIEVHDLSDALDEDGRKVGYKPRTSSSVDAAWARDALDDFERAQEDFVVVGTGHTHPTSGSMTENNEPSIASGYNTLYDYMPMVGAGSKERQGSFGPAASNAFIATQHGLTIHQTMGGTWDGISAHGVEDQFTTDRYGIYDVYDFKGRHAMKSVSGAEEAAHFTMSAKSHGDVMDEEQAAQRDLLMWEMQRHQERGGRL